MFLHLAARRGELVNGGGGMWNGGAVSSSKWDGAEECSSSCAAACTAAVLACVAVLQATVRQDSVKLPASSSLCRQGVLLLCLL